MRENREHNSDPATQERSEGNAKELLAEYERLEAEFRRLSDYRMVARRLLDKPLPARVRQNHEQFEQEFRSIYARLHQILDRQGEIAARLLFRKDNPSG